MGQNRAERRKSMRTGRRTAAAGLATTAVTAALVAGVANAPEAVAAGSTVVVKAGQTWTVDATTRVRTLVVQPGGVITSPSGTSVSLTVNGVETGSRLTSTGGAVTAIKAGTYRGRVVVTVAKANDVTWQGLTFPLRQAIYVGSSGLDTSKSVLAAVTGGRVGTNAASNVLIRSTGEAFNGLYVDNGTYALRNSRIALVGNGRSDFVGYGAAVTSTGTSGKVVLDHVTIRNKGAVRAGVIATGGSTMLVKNSSIHTSDGVLPAGYQSTVDLALMEQAPWMLGLKGNVRASVLLGDGTKATYLNSHVSSTGWGVLSTDTGSNTHLTAINSTVSTTKEGYGSYAIGNATEEFLGDTFNVNDYAVINRGGAVHFGDSTRAAVAALNSSQNLGLTASDLRRTPSHRSVVVSKRFGVMWHGAGSVLIDGHTQFTTAQTAFLDKGQQVNIAVDGSQGAKVVAKNGVVLQVMENDDPGPVMVNGKLVNAGVYHEPTGAATKDATFSTTTAHAATDAVASFAGIKLNGNFYNGMRGDENMDLTFTGSTVTGVISSSVAKHKVSTISSANYKQLGEVTNTAAPAVNNGVIVNLKGSTWVPTGKSYLTSLTLDSAARIKAARGHHVTVTVNGSPVAVQAGHTYTGAIVVTVS